MPTLERRKHARARSLNLLYYACLDEKGRALTQGMGRTLNITEEGILLETRMPLDPQSMMALTLGLKEETLDIMGKVVYSTSDKKGRLRSGIRFMKADNKSLQYLRKFIAEFKKTETDPAGAGL